MPTPFRFTIALVFGWLAAPSVNAADPPKPNTLTEKEIEEGWINLFDGETTFGWKANPNVSVEGGYLILNKSKDGTMLEWNGGLPLAFDLSFEAVDDGNDSPWHIGIGKGGMGGRIPGHNTFHVNYVQSDRQSLFKFSSGIDGVMKHHATAKDVNDTNHLPTPVGPRFHSDGRATTRIRNLKLRPFDLTPLFNNKDLTGWKVFDADPAKAKGKFEVTPAGELSVTGGPGDLQTEGKYGDFVLQARAKTNRPLVNSGLFFRCVPNEFENGYEVQINNTILTEDRTKPLDFGTGAIYRRVKARKVVPNDNEWFTLTVIANGPHLSTWVNGYQTVDWTDDRAPNPNPRNGLRTEAGHISIQAHAPPAPADALFKSIKIAEMKPEKK